MDSIKKIASTLAIAFAGAILAIFLYSKINNHSTNLPLQGTTPIQMASYTSPATPQAQLPDLTQAAEKSVHAVVHITTKVKAQSYSDSDNPLFDFFFGPRGNLRQRGGKQEESEYATGVGSGVIINPDGYIVTNNHVVEDADNIEVTLNDNRKFTAKVIGRDPNTDIALVKIDASNLPYLVWGNSESLKLGEWVLAVGNPFNLTSTVTAGIVSAKSRSGIISGQMSLESFIQTDAAVNPGNSGGALVNASGELVGINSAIASNTGSYEGYSFAVPATIARKVVDDIKQFGEVQRAMLGVGIKTVDDKIAKDEKLGKIEGVYVGETTEGGAARQAGIKPGDVITAVNGTVVNTDVQLREQIGKYRPGDKVSITVKRNGEVKQFSVVLRNTKGDTSIVKESFSVLGAEFSPITEKDKERLKIEEGVQVTNLTSGKLKEAGAKIGFIITDINKTSISNVDDIKRVLSLSSNNKPILVEGVYPNGEWTYYVFKLN